jgi:cell wall-associated NlpC family hydrolase
VSRVIDAASELENHDYSRFPKGPLSCAMKRNYRFILPILAAVGVAGCSHLKSETRSTNSQQANVPRPIEDLGDRTWGIACLSVASAREQPEHKAEMGTQVLMGNVVRVLQGSRIWYNVETADGYRAWVEKGTIYRCTRQEVDAWQTSRLLIVTSLEASVLERPEPGAQPVSDAVLGDLIKRTGSEGEWIKVELPDHRAGYLAKNAAEDYAVWKNSRQPTPENIERTARTLLGRPYLWGANSPKGMDCSGFVKLVFYMNGIELKRNARDQAQQGTAVSLDENFSRFKKGDLVYFGARARGDRPPRVTHIGIYLGEKQFIQSSERVQVSSLDPNSPIRDEHRIRSLIGARRILP